MSENRASSEHRSLAYLAARANICSSYDSALKSALEMYQRAAQLLEVGGDKTQRECASLLCALLAPLKDIGSPLTKQPNLGRMDITIIAPQLKGHSYTLKRVSVDPGAYPAAKGVRSYAGVSLENESFTLTDAAREDIGAKIDAPCTAYQIPFSAITHISLSHTPSSWGLFTRLNNLEAHFASATEKLASYELLHAQREERLQVAREASRVELSASERVRRNNAGFVSYGKYPDRVMPHY